MRKVKSKKRRESLFMLFNYSIWLKLDKIEPPCYNTIGQNLWDCTFTGGKMRIHWVSFAALLSLVMLALLLGVFEANAQQEPIADLEIDGWVFYETLVITVTNNGPDWMSGVDFTLDGGDWTTQTTYTLGDLGSGDSKTLVLELTDAGGYPITATITELVNDPVLENNSAVIQVPILPSADLAVENLYFAEGKLIFNIVNYGPDEDLVCFRYYASAIGYWSGCYHNGNMLPGEVDSKTILVGPGTDGYWNVEVTNGWNDPNPDNNFMGMRIYQVYLPAVTR
jgi:hypothetical protein